MLYLFSILDAYEWIHGTNRGIKIDNYMITVILSWQIFTIVISN